MSARRRGLSFRAEYAGGGAQPAPQRPVLSALRRVLGGDEASAGARRRAPSMLHEPTRHMIPSRRKEDAAKLTVVLDLDETLVYAREGPLFCRPYLDELFELLGAKCETLVWTAGIRPYAQAVVRNIDKHSVVQHCIYRHSRWFSGEPGYVKDLALVGRDLTRTLIVENTPDCVRGYERHGILVADYEGGETDDPTLLIVRQVISDCADSPLSVPEFLSTCPLLTPQWLPTEAGDKLQCLCVNPAAMVTGGPKVNRDLAKYAAVPPHAPPGYR